MCCGRAGGLLLCRVSECVCVFRLLVLSFLGLNIYRPCSLCLKGSSGDYKGICIRVVYIWETGFAMLA